jgi:hypothetical protein
MIIRALLAGIFSCLVVSAPLQAQRAYAARSVLAEGTWYQLGVVREGIYKISATWLTSAGIATTSISSNTIRLYGNGGGRLPENNRTPRADDLVENAIEVFDGGDGIFSGTDYLLFYARGPHQWLSDSTGRNWQHQLNIYADTAFYYLTIGGMGRRVQPQTTAFTPTTPVREMDDRLFMEVDEENLLNSGKDWVGNVMGTQPGQSLTRSFNFNFPGLALSEQVTLISRVATRSVAHAANLRISQQNNLLQDISLPPVGGQFLDQYASVTQQSVRFFPAATNLSLQFQLSSNAGAVTGWIDWLELFARRQLSFAGSPFFSFRDSRSVNTGAVAGFEIQQAPVSGGAFVWDVTNPFIPVKMNSNLSGTILRFANDASVVREYAAGIPGNLPEPTFTGRVANQNLHNSSPVQLLIITHASLLSEARRLGDHHAQKDGLTYAIATTEQIFHEFAGGQADPVALRDWVKMYYDKYRQSSAQKPVYLLLMGAGTYDYRGRKGKGYNLVPVYESTESMHPLFSYTSDDFFGLLDDEEDFNQQRADQLLDIAIGRLPAARAEEAAVMTNKIIRYRQPAAQGPWRMNSVFIADDRDNNLHLNDAEQMTAVTALANENININKLYLDAFPVVSGSGGDRYPLVNEAIVNQCFRGALLVNYTGHGSYFRLSEEAVFTAEEARRFNNPDRLPLFITASCDFAPHDNPAILSLGDRVLKNDTTGGIALMTTTRAVFAYSNLLMNDQYLRAVLTRDVAGNYLTLGKSTLLAKNNTLITSGDVLNNRKFTLLGDPALTLAFPAQRIRLTRFSGNTAGDTLRALGTYTYEGEVTDVAGNRLSGWNGTVEMTVYDQPIIQRTLANRPGSFVTNFKQQNAFLFRGTATVANGQFKVSFVLPKDIRSGIGKARITLYAANEQTDAAGADTSRWIGGTTIASNDDREGPAIRLFLNDTSFKDGGLTHETPLLIALLADSSGISTSGNGIGHDITVVLDNNERDVLVLNDFYTAELDRYTRGSIRYRLPELKEGEHQLRFKAWDVANNSSQKILRFWVKKQDKFTLGPVMNFPNPFINSTTFSIEHNRPGSPLVLQLDIYDVMGRPVRQLRSTLGTAGTRNVQVQWDGNGPTGAKVPKGIYIYHLKLTSGSSSAQVSGRILRN